MIGTDVTGTAAIANGNDGVEIDTGATGNTIGGLTSTPGTGAGNVISGNTSDGVEITGSGTSGQRVAGEHHRPERGRHQRTGQLPRRRNRDVGIEQYDRRRDGKRRNVISGNSYAGVQTDRRDNRQRRTG